MRVRTILACLGIFVVFLLWPGMRPAAAQTEHTMKFGAVLGEASYQSPFHMEFRSDLHPAVKPIVRLMAYDPPKQVMLEDVTNLEETGVGIIRIDFYFDPWLLENSPDPKLRAWAAGRREAFDAVVAKIRKDGKKLFIADAAAGYYANFGHFRHHPMTWDQYRVAQQHQVETLARRYKPDYYEVVKEYRWYSDWGNISEVPTAEQWAAQTEALCKIVKKADPKAQTAVGLIALSKLDHDVLQRIVHIPDLDIIGIDIYGLRDLNVLLTGEFSRFVHEHGKEAWVAEVWTSTLGSFNDPQRETTDAQFLQAVLQVALNQRMSGYIPFFTVHFFFYDLPSGWDTETQQEFDASFTPFLEKALHHRTASFQTYQRCIRDVREGRGLEP
jgi:hypothetical protein